ncbi:MAG: phosphoribosyltransferase, partial [Candidatus Micrarchaeota archaeon]|nr:phosphoribosyltransferase [Candidatus Micrarchaeota archaeon]
NPELAIGAVAPDGAFFPNREALIALGIPEEFARRAAAIVSEEVERRLERFRGSKKYDLKGRTIVIVDDGIATGATMFAAVEWAGRQSPKRLIVAVPVGPKETLERLSGLAEVVALQSPTLFMAVGEFYTLFDQVADERVVEIMRSHGYALKP